MIWVKRIIIVETKCYILQRKHLQCFNGSLKKCMFSFFYLFLLRTITMNNTHKPRKFVTGANVGADSIPLECYREIGSIEIEGYMPKGFL